MDVVPLAVDVDRDRLASLPLRVSFWRVCGGIVMVWSML
jgi:hypothetical protein